MQQVIVVQQAAPAAVVEPEMNCCGCIEIKCGLTTLMVFEVFYLIGFIFMLATVVFVGAVGASMSSGTYNGNNASINAMNDKINDAADALLYVGIGLIIAEIPRMYYLCKLCGFCCCGGKARDSVADRSGIVMAMKALALNQILSIVIIIIVIAATSGDFGPVTHFILNFVVNLLFTAWWIMDLNKWVAAKSV